MESLTWFLFSLLTSPLFTSHLLDILCELAKNIVNEIFSSSFALWMCHRCPFSCISLLCYDVMQWFYFSLFWIILSHLLTFVLNSSEQCFHVGPFYSDVHWLGRALLLQMRNLTIKDKQQHPFVQYVNKIANSHCLSWEDCQQLQLYNKTSRIYFSYAKGRPQSNILLGLPLKMLAQIFIHCLPGHLYTIPCMRNASLSLLPVCRHWREVVITTPQLWWYLNAIHDYRLVVPLLQMNDRDMIGYVTWLSRSRSCLFIVIGSIL